MEKNQAASEQLQPAADATPKKPQPERRLRLRFGAVGSGVLLITGFVLPWVKIADVARVSGLELMISDNVVVSSAVGPLQRGLVSLVPIVALILIVWGARNFPGLRWGLLGGGLVLLVFGLVVLLTIFVQVTSLGLWLVVSGLLVTLIVGGLVKA